MDSYYCVFRKIGRQKSTEIVNNQQPPTNHQQPTTNNQQPTTNNYMCLMIASPNSEHLTSVAPSISRAKS